MIKGLNLVQHEDNAPVIATRRMRGAGRPERQAEASRETKVFARALTVIRLAPPQVIEVAARTGYDTVELRLVGGTEITPAYPLMDDKR